MTNTFDWIEIRTHDIEKTAAFYQSVFGWKITEKETTEGFPVWIFDTMANPRLENLRRGGIWLRPESEPAGIVVFIFVEDIDATLQKVVELQGSVISARAPLAGGFGAFFRDPSGNLLGLYEEASAA